MKILITHVFGYANKGDWALLASLQKILRAEYPDAELRGICRDPNTQAQYFPDITWYTQLGTSYKAGIRRRLENILGLVSGFIKAYFPLEFKSINRRSTITAIRTADLVVCCPGGYLEDSNLGIATNLVHIWLASRFCNRVILAPQSIGPINSRFWRKLTRLVLMRTEKIIVRERKSLDLVLQDLKIEEEKVLMLPDMAFYDFEINIGEAERKLSDLMGCGNQRFACGTVINWYFPFAQDATAARNKYVAEYASAVEGLYRATGMKTLLLKQVESHLGGNGDDALMSEVAALAGDACICCYENFTPEVMKGIISKSSVFLGSRMHSNIFALQSGTPVVAIGYLPKTSGIMAMCALDDYVIDIADINGEKLVQMMGSAMLNKERFEAAREIMSSMGETGRQSFIDVLHACVGSGDLRHISKNSVLGKVG